MSEPESPRGLQYALDDFRARISPRVRPPGAAAVHTTVRRRRRRNRLVAVAAVVAVASVGTYALLGAAPDRTVGPSTSNGGSPLPFPDGSSAGPSASASSSPSASAAAYGRMSLEELAVATVELPAWSQSGCPSGRFTFHGQATRSGVRTVKIEKLAYPDVDRDGAPETAALLSCTGGDPAGQVVVLDRAASGAVTTVGQVVRTGGAIKALFDVAASGAQVQVEVGDYRGCCGESAQLPQHQWRSYAWSGTAFQQVDGPRSFPANPYVADIAVTATDLVWGPTEESTQAQYGTVVVTIRNLRGGTPPNAVLKFKLSGDIYMNSEFAANLAGWSGCTFAPEAYTAECPVNVPAADGVRELTFGFRHGAMHGAGFTESVRVDARLPDGTTAPDLNGANNEAQFVTR